ncbi:unnamed protein product [Discosporangium mesarthrocarpum]
METATGPIITTAPGTPTGHWFLEEELYVEDGITLNVHGGVDGDAQTLRVLSDDDTVVNIRGYGGSLDFMDTVVTSWEVDDDGDGKVRELSGDQDPRSYIR